MGIFSKIFSLFQKNKPYHEFLDAYAEVHQLASILPQTLAKLRKIQREMVNLKRTGGMGLHKTLFIEEEFMRRLQQLAQEAEQRYFEAMEKEHEQQPLSPLEQAELTRIIHFLKEVQQRVPHLKDIEDKKSVDEKLLAVENALREITDLARKFYTIENYEKDLIKKILDSQISPLLRRIHEKPEVIKYREQGKIKHLYIATLHKSELRDLELEAQKINASQDPKYSVTWTHWWRDIQMPERDFTTPLKDPHINVIIRLDGKKKDIHLLLAA